MSEKDLYDILVSKRSKKFIRYSDIASNIPSISNVARQLSKSLDLQLIKQRLPTWRQESTSKLEWLKEILRRLESIAFEAGHLLDVASTIDFNNGLLDASHLLEDVVNLLREETIDKFFIG